MRRAIPFLVVFSLICGAACWAAPRGKRAVQKKATQKKHEAGPEVVSPAVADKDPDFHVQGEYLGEAVHFSEASDSHGGREKIGAQVVARGDGNFEIYLLEGGLPGQGWKKGDKRVQVAGKREGGFTSITGEGVTGQIQGATMTLECKETNGKATLKRVERTSLTIGDRPPKGAKVLFGANGANDFEAPQLSEDGDLVAGTTTKDKFNSYRLHLEFRLSWKPQATGQARSNSGVYVHDCYEVQVLDSFGLEGADNECGGLYKIKAPDVNMCLPPLIWQSYDIDFTAPEYDAAGKKTRDSRLTVRQNGVLIHNDVDLPGDTPGREKEGPGPRSLHLQAHSNHVEYRNIWLVPR